MTGENDKLSYHRAPYRQLEWGERLPPPHPKLMPYAIGLPDNDWRADAVELSRLIEDSEDERPLQSFFTQRPHVLLAGVLATVKESWLIPHPRFGSTWVPDYLLGLLDSHGYRWNLIELESPRKSPLTSGGSLNADLHHAEEQIKDYQRWLAGHALFAEKELGCCGIVAGTASWIVMGRRRDRDRGGEHGRMRLADLERNGGNIHVMSYDRVLENYQSQAEWWDGRSRRLTQNGAEAPSHREPST